MAKPVPAATGTWDTAVELSDVTKTFSQRRVEGGLIRNLLHPEYAVITALERASLRMRKGEFIAYAGPNGAGKSTTFKLLCGMLAPDGGTVRAMGLDPVRDRVALMKRTGVLFGNRTELWWDHPVRASYEWKKAVWDIPDAVYSDRLALVTELLGLKELLGAFARELSLGQRMRADLGMMLLHAPELVLLDEPTLGLDVLAKRQMIEFLKHINREEGVTILVTSHDIDDLAEMARRLVLINQGKIAFDGSGAELSEVTGDHRVLKLRAEGAAPEITGALWEKSEGGWHFYRFDASETPVTSVLMQVARAEGVLDVELARAPIEAVIAELYRTWKQ